MIGHFFDCLRRNARNGVIRTFEQRLKLEAVELIEQILPHHRQAEITIWLLDKEQVSELPDIAKHRQIIRAAPVAFSLCCKAKPHLRLPDQIKRGIGKRDILFERGPMATPLGDTVSEDQRVIAQAAKIFEPGVHIAPTSSGMSKKVGWR